MECKTVSRETIYEVVIIAFYTEIFKNMMVYTVTFTDAQCHQVLTPRICLIHDVVKLTRETVRHKKNEIYVSASVSQKH